MIFKKIFYRIFKLFFVKIYLLQSLWSEHYVLCNGLFVFLYDAV